MTVSVITIGMILVCGGLIVHLLLSFMPVTSRVREIIISVMVDVVSLVTRGLGYLLTGRPFYTVYMEILMPGEHDKMKREKKIETDANDIINIAAMISENRDYCDDVLKKVAENGIGLKKAEFMKRKTTYMVGCAEVDRMGEDG